MHELIADNLDGIRTALTAVLTDPETVLHGLDLAARLNRRPVQADMPVALPVGQR